MKVFTLTSSAAILLASIPAVLGHGYIVDPAATWKDGYAVNGWGSSIDNNMFGVYDNSIYGYGTAATVAFFEAVFPVSGYDSLGQFIDTNQVMYSDDIDPECGYTVYDEDSRSTMPSDNLTYTGFTHPGPCEVWCDDNKVLFDYDCQTAYPEGTMPYDESLCEGANRFTIYWIGLHGAPWQVFTDCVWLENGGSSSGSAPSPVTEEVDADVTTAPPTSGSGSDLTATTAAPSGSGTSPTVSPSSSSSTTTGSTTSSTTSTSTTSITTSAETSTAASVSASSTASDAEYDESSSGTATTSTISASASSMESEAEDDEYTSSTASKTSDESSSSSTETTSTTTTSTTTTITPTTATAAPTATSSESSDASTTTATTTDSSSTEDKCSIRRRRRD